MKMAMDNYLNHLWINNIMNPLAPAVAPMLHHNMQQHWGLPTHFNPLINPMTNPKPLFLRSSGTYPKQPSVLSLDITTSSKNDFSSNPNSIRNPPGEPRKSSYHELVHRNIKPKRSSPYVVPSVRGRSSIKVALF
uniref:Uncharacterized protein n=1 Tax=Solanum tuberosum TaxID=4113 RepID=M1DER5_SOLTU